MRFFFFADPHAFECHLYLVNQADLEIILQTEVFVNQGDLQVRAAYKILGYDPIQKSFTAPKYVIKAKDPRLQKITVAEHGFFLPEGSSAQGGVVLASSSSSQQATETEERGEEGEEQVIELDQSEDEFGAFDQFDPSEDPSGDLGDPSLTEADLQGISSQADMGFKRKPSAGLLDLIEGQPGKDVPGKSQPKLSPPPSKPQPPQTRSSSVLPQPSKLPPLVQPADPKRKRFAKGKDLADGGRSRSSQEEDEGRRASKQLRITPQGQEKEVVVQPEPQAWLPAPMFHGEPLMDNASLRDFNRGEGIYMADALQRSLLLPADMANLKNLRRQEIFLSMKRYLGMVRFSTFVALLAFVP